MKTLFNYILIFLVLLQSVNLHFEDIKDIKIFASDAIEHLEAGDSFISFLQKHYGDIKTVTHHFAKEHPDRKPDKKHNHLLETHMVWSFETSIAYYIPLVMDKQQINFSYLSPSSIAYLEPLFSPPELI